MSADSTNLQITGMPNVLHLSRELEVPPVRLTLPQINVRNYVGPDDIERWLNLRHRAFARQPVGVRQWSHDDFLAEFTDRWWWRPDWMWLAEFAPTDSAEPQLIGTVALAMRGEPDNARPVVHWLMVLPGFRRRGIGRLLMDHLEHAAWEAGHRRIWLETHAAWEAAAKFYEARGYRPDE